VSAIAAAAYNSSNTTDSYLITNADFPYYDALVTAPFKQGGLQLAATFISIGISLATSALTGLIIYSFYNYRSQ